MKRTYYMLRQAPDDIGCEYIPTWCFDMIAIQPQHLAEMLSGTLWREVHYCLKTSKLIWNDGRKERQVTVDALEVTL